MAEPFLAEIRIVGFNFAMRNWAQCDGQILPISQNQSLFSILGTTYGGDGRTSFALPEIRGRSALFWGSGSGLSTHVIGEKSGEQNVTLTQNQIPRHSHKLMVKRADASMSDPAGKLLARSDENTYHPGGNPTPMNSSALSTAGSGQSHNNLQPYLALNFLIALRGLFPSRN